jgi:hypothetical protein
MASIVRRYELTVKVGFTGRLRWGILRPSGRLRHPVFVRWAETAGSRKHRTNSPSQYRP